MRRLSLLLPLLIALPGAAAEVTIEDLVRVMNEYQAVHSLPPLAVDERLQKAAGDRLADMEALEYWAHVAPDGKSPFVWLTANGYRYSHAGENLAAGFETAEVLVESWMQSKGHRANVLSPHVEQVGIAIIDGRIDRRASGKSVVVLFAREAPR